MPKSSGAFYAVHSGKTPGIYATWEDCQQQVLGFPKAQFKKFRTKGEAEAFVRFGPAAGKVARAAGSGGSSTGSEKLVSDRTKSTYMQRKLGKAVERPKPVYGPEWNVVYTDGACRGNGREGATAGVGIWWGENDYRNLAERCPGAQTNNRAELIAIIRALETAPKDIKRLLIKTDSSYAIQCIRDWMPAWRKRGWKTSDGKDVKNKGVIMFLARILDEHGAQGRIVQLEHVRGHAGEEGNEGADRLATAGASMPEQPERDWTILEQSAPVEKEYAAATIEFDAADVLSFEEMKQMAINGHFN